MFRFGDWRGGPWRSSIWATGATECGSGFRRFNGTDAGAAGVRSYRRRGQNFIEASHRRRDGNRGQGRRQRHLDDDLGQRRDILDPQCRSRRILGDIASRRLSGHHSFQVTNHGGPGDQNGCHYGRQRHSSASSHHGEFEHNTTGRAARQGEAEPVGALGETAAGARVKIADSAAGHGCFTEVPTDCRVWNSGSQYSDCRRGNSASCATGRTGARASSNCRSRCDSSGCRARCIGSPGRPIGAGARSRGR